MLTTEEREEIIRAHMSQAASQCALEYLLVEKGIVTIEEIEVTKVRCMAEMDQHVAELRDALAATPQPPA